MTNQRISKLEFLFIFIFLRCGNDSCNLCPIGEYRCQSLEPWSIDKCVRRCWRGANLIDWLMSGNDWLFGEVNLHFAHFVSQKGMSVPVARWGSHRRWSIEPDMQFMHREKSSVWNLNTLCKRYIASIKVKNGTYFSSRFIFWFKEFLSKIKKTF